MLLTDLSKTNFKVILTKYPDDHYFDFKKKILKYSFIEKIFL